MHNIALNAIDMNLLVVLRALLTERHVTRAASRVGLSQSATSHALSRLRDLYGDPLLVRSGKRLDLTPRALSLLPQLERGLDELWETVKGEPAFDPATAQRSFTIGMADYGQAVLLQPLLSILGRKAPGIDVLAVSFPNSLELLDAGSMDLALLVEADLPNAFSSKTLFSDGFMCMVRRNHPSIRGKTMTLEQYLAQGHVLVSPSGSPGSLVDSELARRGLQRRIALRVSNFLVAPLVVAESDLVTTGPERILVRMEGLLPVRLLPSPLRIARFELDLVWHSRRDHDPALLWLRGALEEASREI